MMATSECVLGRARVRCDIQSILFARLTNIFSFFKIPAVPLCQQRDSSLTATTVGGNSYRSQSTHTISKNEF